MCSHRFICSQIHSPCFSCPLCQRDVHFHHCLPSGFHLDLFKLEALEYTRGQKEGINQGIFPSYTTFAGISRAVINLHCGFSFLWMAPPPIGPSYCLVVLTVLVPVTRCQIWGSGTIFTLHCSSSSRNIHSFLMLLVFWSCLTNSCPAPLFPTTCLTSSWYCFLFLKHLEWFLIS